MNDFLYLLLAALACFRVSRLLAIDDGPFLIFLHMRARLGVYDLAQNGLPKSTVGSLFSCPHCLGLWIAIAFGLARILFGEGALEVILYWLAVAGGQSFLWSLARKAEE